MCAGERPFKCESCNYLAANQHEVTRHARQVHNGPKPLSCPYCDYKTADRSNYKKHVELHLNPRQFLCPLCKYAASKKCNLQYHIKSRHAGCDVAMDISKVKLRVKKAGPNGGEENAREHKLNNTSSAQEDLDVDRESRDKGAEANPINLSTRRSSRPGTSQSGQSDAPDQAEEKPWSPSDREKAAKVGEQENRISTRQKVKRAHQKVPEEDLHPGPSTASKTVEGKAKTRVKKLQAGKTPACKTAEEPEQELGAEPQQGEERRKARPDKENGSSQSSRRKKKVALHRSRRASQPADGSQPKASSQEQRGAKEKAPKRKAAEALDLTRTSPDMAPKTRRMKGAERLRPGPEEPGQAGPLRPAATGSKQKKSKTAKDDSLSVCSPSPTTAGPSSAQQACPGPPGGAEPAEAGDSPPKPASPGKPQQSRDGSQKAVDEPHSTGRTPPNPASPPGPAPEPEPAGVDHAPAQKLEDRSSSQEVTSPPSVALPVEQSKAGDPEEDEGIHSSAEGASDISDSASEGSEDSGLNSNGSRSAKLANDPESPTEEMATPTQLRSHTCIFCDRGFAVEAAYRRHLHRHLLNVYYMDNPGASAQN